MQVQHAAPSWQWLHRPWRLLCGFCMRTFAFGWTSAPEWGVNFQRTFCKKREALQSPCNYQ
jgi:hypothetical protein